MAERLKATKGDNSPVNGVTGQKFYCNRKFESCLGISNPYAAKGKIDEQVLADIELLEYFQSPSQKQLYKECYQGH